MKKNVPLQWGLRRTMALVFMGLLLPVAVFNGLLVIEDLRRFAVTSHPAHLVWVLLDLILFILTMIAFWRAARAWQYFRIFGFIRNSGARADNSGWMDAYLAGELAIEQQDWTEVVACMRRRQEADPRDMDAVFNIGNVQAWKGDWEVTVEAVKVFDPGYKRLRWLVGRSDAPKEAKPGLGWPRSAYFNAAGLKEIPRSSTLLAWCVVSLVLALPIDIARGTAMALQYQEYFDSGISEKGFDVTEDERFTFYHHSDRYFEWGRDVAQRALDANLKFYGFTDDRYVDHPIKMFLCRDRGEFNQRSPGLQPWVAGYAIPGKNSVVMYRRPANEELDSRRVMAHELSHIVFHDFYAPTPSSPVESILNIGFTAFFKNVINGSAGRGSYSWINEGLADYIGFEWVLRENDFLVANWLTENQFNGLAGDHLPFDLFLQGNPHNLDKVEDIEKFYKQGFSMVFVLIEYYGKDEFMKFLQYYSRNQDVGASLVKAYPTIDEIGDLEAIWSLFMK